MARKYTIDLIPSLKFEGDALEKQIDSLKEKLKTALADSTISLNDVGLEKQIKSIKKGIENSLNKVTVNSIDAKIKIDLDQSSNIIKIADQIEYLNKQLDALTNNIIFKNGLKNKLNLSDYLVIDDGVAGKINKIKEYSEQLKPLSEALVSMYKISGKDVDTNALSEEFKSLGEAIDTFYASLQNKTGDKSSDVLANLSKFTTGEYIKPIEKFVDDLSALSERYKIIAEEGFANKINYDPSGISAVNTANASTAEANIEGTVIEYKKLEDAIGNGSIKEKANGTFSELINLTYSYMQALSTLRRKIQDTFNFQNLNIDTTKITTSMAELGSDIDTLSSRIGLLYKAARGDEQAVKTVNNLKSMSEAANNTKDNYRRTQEELSKIKEVIVDSFSTFDIDMDPIQKGAETLKLLVDQMSRMRNISGEQVANIGAVIKNISTVFSSSKGVDSKTIENLSTMLKGMNALTIRGDKIGKLDFSGFSEINVDTKSMKSLAETLPVLAPFKYNNLADLAKIKWNNLNELKINKKSVRELITFSTAISDLAFVKNNIDEMRSVFDKLKQQMHDPSVVISDLDSDLNRLNEDTVRVKHTISDGIVSTRTVTSLHETEDALHKITSTTNLRTGTLSQSIETVFKNTKMNSDQVASALKKVEDLLLNVKVAANNAFDLGLDNTDDYKQLVECEEALNELYDTLSGKNGKKISNENFKSVFNLILGDAKSSAKALSAQTKEMEAYYKQSSSEAEKYYNDLEKESDAALKTANSEEKAFDKAAAAAENKAKREEAAAEKSAEAQAKANAAYEEAAEKSAKDAELSSLKETNLGKDISNYISKYQDVVKELGIIERNIGKGGRTSELKSNIEDIINRLRKLYTELSSSGDQSSVSLKLSGITKDYKKIESAVRDTINANKQLEAEAQKAAQANEKAVQNAIKADEKAASTVSDISAKMTAAISTANKIGYIGDSVTRINELSESLSKLNSQYESGELAPGKYAEEISKISKEVDSCSKSINTADKSQKIYKKDTDEYYKAQVQLNSVIHQGTKYLNNYTKSKTGKTSSNYEQIQRDVDALNTLNEELKAGNKNQEAFDTKLHETSADLTKNKTVIYEAGEATGNFGDKLKDVVNKFSMYFSASRLFMEAVRYMRQMVTEVVNLDDSMTQLEIVTNASNSELEEFTDNIIESAKQLGVTVADLVDSVTTFSRLGYSLDESSTMASLTGMLEKVGDIDEEDATDAITAIIKAFDVDVDDLESVMDKLVVTGNNFPISVEQIAEGMTNASSALAAARNTFEESTALLMAANTTIQNASKSSTGLRTIAARLRNTTTELDELGESMTTAEYDNIIKALTTITTIDGETVSVSLTNEVGELRSTYDVLEDIAEVWGRIDENSKAAIAETLSGTRQQAVFYSIMQNMVDGTTSATEAIKQMDDAGGALEESYSTYADSITGRINSLKASFTELSNNIIDSDIAKEVVDIGTYLLNIINKIFTAVEKLGGLKAIISDMSAIVLAINASTISKKFEVVYSKITDIIENVNLFRRGMQKARMEGKSFTDQIQGGFERAETSVSSFQLELSAVCAVFTLLVTLSNAWREKIEEDRDKISSASEDAVSSNNDISESISDYYSTLNDYGYKSDEFNDANDTLIDSLGGASTAFDTASASAEGYTKAILKASKQKIDDNNADILSNIGVDKKEASEYFLKNVAFPTVILGNNKEVNTLISDYNSKNNIRDLDLLDGLGSIDIDAVAEYYDYLVDIKNLLYDTYGEEAIELKAYESINDAIANIDEAMGDYFSDVEEYNNGVVKSASIGTLLDTLDGKLPETTEEFNNYKQALVDTITSSGKFIGSEEDAVAAVDEYLSGQTEFSQFFETTAEDVSNGAQNIIDSAMNTIENGYKNGATRFADIFDGTFSDSEDIESYRASFGQLRSELISAVVSSDSFTGSTTQAVAAVDQYLSETPGLSEFFEAFCDGTTAATEDTELLSSAVSEAMSSLSGYKEFMSGIADDGYVIDEDALEKLISYVGDDYINYLTMSGNQIKLNTEAWNEYISAQGNSLLYDTIESNIDSLKLQRKAILDAMSATSGNAEVQARLKSELEDVNAELLNNEQQLGVVSTLMSDAASSAYDMSTTASFITDLTDSLSTLADIQEEVSDGFVISMEKALEYAEVYPEILAKAESAGDGQIKLNEDVVNSFIEGKESELNASAEEKIKELETDKSGLEAKRALAKAELELLSQVLNGTSTMTAQEAADRISIANNVAQLLISSGIDQATAYGYALQNMDENTLTLDGTVADVAQNIVDNFTAASGAAASNIQTNMQAANVAVASTAAQAWDTADAIAAMPKGAKGGSVSVRDAKSGATVAKALGSSTKLTQYDNGSYTGNKLKDAIATIKKANSVSINLTSGGSYDGYSYEYTDRTIKLGDYISELTADIKGYDEELSQIDGQIAILKNISTTDLSSFRDASSSSSGTNSSAGSTGASSDSDSYFAKMYNYHKHLLEMDQEEYGDYFAWLDKAYKEAYNNGEITLDEYYKYEEEVYNGVIEMVEDANDAFEELVQFRKQMLEDEYEDEKDLLESKLDLLEDYYNEQVEMLEDEKDEEEYIEEQSEKRKTVSDIQSQIDQLQYDDSAWAQKKRAELQDELIEAQEDLSDFEQDHADELAKETLESAYENEKSLIEEQISGIEEILNDPNALYNQALDDVKNNTKDLYDEMVAYAKANGEQEQTVKELWETAYTSTEDLSAARRADVTGVESAVNNVSTSVGKYISDSTAGITTAVTNATNYSTNAVTSSAPSQSTTSTTTSTSSSSSTSSYSSTTSTPSTSASSATSTSNTSSSSSRTPSVGTAVNVSGLMYSTVKGTGNSANVNGRTMYVAQVWNNAANPYWQGEYIYGLSYTPGGRNDGWVKLSQLSGYAYGTRSATAGLHRVDELGSEGIFTSANGNRYRMLSSGDKVLTADATSFLYNFANSKGSILGNMVSDLMSGGSLNNISSGNTNNITMSPITINGNADSQTVSEIRRAQRDALTETLKAFSKLQK